MTTLVVCRLASMGSKHPDQDDTHVCGTCGERVGIYPSGQTVIRARPDTEILCDICAAAEQLPVLSMPAPGAIEEALDHVRKRRRQ